MDYRKETHFIVAYDGANMRGKWDILTNEFIGIKGTIVKSKPAAFATKYICGMSNSFRNAFELVKDATTYYDYTAEHAKRLEEIISVGLIVDSGWDSFQHLLDYKTKLTKDCVTFINEHYRGVYNSKSMGAYNAYKKHKSFLSKCGNQDIWALNILARVNDDIPKDFVEGMILRAIHEKIYFCQTGYYNHVDLANIINDWYEKVTFLGDALEVKHNILTNYQILKYLYEEYKTAHYDEKLNKMNNKSWLYFENDRYEVKPLLTRADFHREAEIQQNCVERMYMERVVTGATHVVAVRLKSDPTIPYITCEVSNKGAIIQYLHKCNSRAMTPDDAEFKVLYQNHLSSVNKD